MPANVTPTSEGTRHVKVAIVGSGFSGLGAAIRLDQSGHRDFLVFERGNDVGGTWRDNTRPLGFRADMRSGWAQSH